MNNIIPNIYIIGGATLAHPLRQIRLIAVSATWYAGGREGGREGRGGEGRGGEGTVHTFHKPEPL